MKSNILIYRPQEKALSAYELGALCFMFLASIFVAVASLPGVAPAQRAPFVIVFPPWTSADEAVARSIVAGHLVLRSGGTAFVVIVAAAAEVVPVRRPKGAVLVLMLAGLAGCLDEHVKDAAAT